MTELSGYVFSALRGGEFTLYRGSGDGLQPILLVAPIGEYPAGEPLKRLEHEHDLKAKLDAGWAVRPIALSRHDGRMALVLEDPGGEPLDRLLGSAHGRGRVPAPRDPASPPLSARCMNAG